MNLPLIEVAVAGRPLITTDVPGCCEIVRDGENGFIVPVKNVEVLADEIKVLINHLYLSARMERSG